MSILKKLVITFLILIISYYVFRFSVIYSDVILSIGAKKGLSGKIVYSLQGHYIKVIELPSGRKKAIYSVPQEPNRYLASAISPSFSPDGKKIIFSKRDDPRVDRKYRLWIMNSDGTDIKRFLEINYKYLLAPVWSPDGKKIAFIARNSQKGGEGGLYVTDADNPVSFYCVSNILSSPAQPTWSSDSREIAFSSEELFSRPLGRNLRVEVDRGGIYLVDIFGKSSRKLVNLASEPSWSPDGKKLVYGTKNGYYVAELINGYLYNKQLIIPYKKFFIGEGGAFPIRWSPDGKYVVFCKEIWPGLAGIYVVAVDNPKRQIRIATDYIAIIGMSWAE